MPIEQAPISHGLTPHSLKKFTYLLKAPLEVQVTSGFEVASVSVPQLAVSVEITIFSEYLIPLRIGLSYGIIVT
jgi:hypothetical protein